MSQILDNDIGTLGCSSSPVSWMGAVRLSVFRTDRTKSLRRPRRRGSERIGQEAAGIIAEIIRNYHRVN